MTANHDPKSRNSWRATALSGYTASGALVGNTGKDLADAAAAATAAAAPAANGAVPKADDGAKAVAPPAAASEATPPQSGHASYVAVVGYVNLPHHFCTALCTVVEGKVPAEADHSTLYVPLHPSVCGVTGLDGRPVSVGDKLTGRMVAAAPHSKHPWRASSAQYVRSRRGWVAPNAQAEAARAAAGGAVRRGGREWG